MLPSRNIKMKINRKMFFDKYIEVFGNIKMQKTVNSIEAILDVFEANIIKIRAVEKWAYMLATVRHECGSKMIPITENLRYSARRLTQVWPSRFPTIDHAKPYADNPEKLGNAVYGSRLGNGCCDGYKFRGRGFIQITGADNYRKFSKLLNIDLIFDPDLALDLKIGAEILYVGMINGLFTGKRLSGSIHSNNVDYYNARDIVNADKKRVGQSIAKDTKLFENILRYSIDK